MRLHEDGFDQEVACARLGVPYLKNNEPQGEHPVAPAAVKGTLRWLLQEYKRQARGTISVDLMERRIRVLEEICETYKPDKEGKTSKVRRGDLPYALMERRHITEVNPCAGIKRQKSGDGFHTWTIEEVRQFEAKHPIGTKARLALHIALFAGLRRSDLIILGRQHLQNGWIVMRPQKTVNSSNVLVEIPLLSCLKKTVAASPIGDLTWLINDYGRPFTEDGFGIASASGARLGSTTAPSADCAKQARRSRLKTAQRTIS